MSTILSIDPGIKGVGAAIWVDDQLIKAEYVKNNSDERGPRECATMALRIIDWLNYEGFGFRPLNLVMEFPQTYRGRAAKGDANDLFLLAGVDAALAALLPDAKVTYYYPSQWKGNLPKPKTGEEYIVEMRVRKKLSADELACVKWPGSKKLRLDVSDALGIGIKFLGR